VVPRPARIHNDISRRARGNQHEIANGADQHGQILGRRCLAEKQLICV
jgi:hypothetical protein